MLFYTICTIWDLINIVLLSVSFLFLVGEWLRAHDRTLRNWSAAVLTILVNYVILFTFRLKFEFLNAFSVPSSSGIPVVKSLPFSSYFPTSLHLAYSDLAWLVFLAVMLKEIMPPQPRFKLVVQVQAALLGVVCFLQLLGLAGVLGRFINVFLILWSLAALGMGIYAVNRYCRRGPRIIYFVLLVTMAISLFSYQDISLLKVVYLLGSTVAFITLAVHLGRAQQRLFDRLEQRSSVLITERDVIISVMQDIGREIRSITEVDQTLEIIIKKAMHVLRAQAGAMYLVDPQGGKLSAVVVEGYFPPLFKMAEYATTRKEHIARIMKKHKTAVGEGLIGMVALSREPLLIKEGGRDPRITQYGKDAASLNTLLAAPLMIKDELQGVIAVVNKENGESFNENEAALFNSLATQTAITINNAKLYASLAEQERIRREVEFAKNIQQNLLPKQIPQVNGIQLAGSMIPALEVGGDYYDFIKRSDQRVNLVIGDVAGKGLPAGMIMLMIRTILHAISSAYTSTKEVICAASQLMISNLNPGEFMTLIYLDWDNETRTMHYTSAGHEHIVIYRTALTRCENIMSGGIAIGMHDDIGQFIEEKSLAMMSGDIVVLYTDGITEALNTAGEMYGLDRLMKTIEANRQYGAEDLKNIIAQDITKFVGNTPQHDDITMIVAKII